MSILFFLFDKALHGLTDKGVGTIILTVRDLFPNMLFQFRRQGDIHQTKSQIS